jgi:tetratricopeptide (TPR) repeat protein
VRVLAVVAPALLLVIYGAGTLVESAAWTSEAALWSKAVALEPRSAQARRNLGLILLQRGQPALALRHLDEARTLGEQAGELDRRRAMALEALGRLPEAEAAAAEAVRRDPELGAGYALLGGLLVKRGAVAEAERALARARTLEPDRPSTLLLEVELAAATGDVARELAAEERLLERYPREPRFHHRRALTLLRAGRNGEAAASARQCLRLAAAQPQCACALGRALVVEGGGAALEEARRMIKMGLAALPAGAERAGCEEARSRVR